MPVIVQKYGGSSLATPAHIQQVAQLIRQRVQTGAQLCVVVSAMGKNTNELLKLAHQISSNPVRRELDMLLSCGERASMALLAMALSDLGVPSVSFTGSQSGIMTNNVHSDAKIIAVKPFRVQDSLNQGKVVIIAGFQGVSEQKEITTLGRGGSDTTAVAMAAALGAEACEIYSDVPGVYRADPRVVSNPEHIDQLSADEMLELASSGAKVLNADAIAYAKLKGIVIKAKKTGDDSLETQISPVLASPVQTLDAITAQEKLHCFRFESIQALQNLLLAMKTLSLEPHQIVGTNQGFCLIAPENSHGVSLIPAMQGISRLTDCASVSLIGNDLGSNMEIIHTVFRQMEHHHTPILGMVSSKLRLCFFIESSEVSMLIKNIYSEIFQ